jgi:alkanesulfonate monooxygenase SsuD/methylene tetrahydromethanopterin reductase-like flavin-dependent oxidoreductase (luciferase family)
VRIGIGLPSTIPWCPGPLIVDWALRAEERGFASLATIDRIVYPSHDSLVAISAAAAATQRVDLMTNILLAPAYSPVLLAKQAASVDRISEGRFVLGMAPGARPDDFEAVGVAFHRRGRAFDDGLADMHEVWGAGHPVGPKPHDGERVRIMFGGTSDAAIRRTARWGRGWTAGGSAAEIVGPFADRVRTAWREAGRGGDPWIAALAYYSLGDNDAESSRYILDYYAYVGPHAQGIDSAVHRTPAAVKDAVAGFRDAGVDELFLDPTVPDLGQVDLLADSVL